jgi:hypothetical protein
MAMSPKPKAKKVLPKRPTGELPKRMSKLAMQEYYRSGAEGKKNLITPSQAGAQAGKSRDNLRAVASKVGKLAAKSNLDAAALAKARAKAKKNK